MGRGLGWRHQQRGVVENVGWAGLRFHAGRMWWFVVNDPVTARAREFEVERVVTKRQDLLRIDETVVDRSGNEIGDSRFV